MAAKTSPYVEASYGWNLGESGWNTGMDENLKKFSFLFDSNIESIVSSLPLPPTEGKAYFLTTDNRVYFVIDGVYSSTVIPKWFQVVIKSTGVRYQFDGNSLVALTSTASLDARVGVVENTISTLGTAAFENSTFFTAKSEFDSFKDMLLGDDGATHIANKPDLTGSIKRSLDQKLIEAISVADFGAVGDGVTDNTSAFNAAILSGVKTIYIPKGIYYFNTGPSFSGMSGITFKGESSTTSMLRWPSGQFVIKSPTNCNFIDIGFSPIPNDLTTAASYTEVWMTNATNVNIVRCRFEGFGSATNLNKPGSVCLYVYAGDIETSYAATGDTKNVRITDCVFLGQSRKTNFGVRVYTEFSAASVATNTGCVVRGCTFEEFNWNALECVGLTTSHMIVSDCVASRCGLVPFDMDKGVHHCIFSNLTINRLLGNVDLSVNPNTRSGIVGVQGVSPSFGYAYNNTITNITANLLKADVDAYGNGMMACYIAYAHSNKISNINLYCDGVPVRASGKSFGLAVVAFETASNNIINGITTTNCSSGIVQTGQQNGNMTSAAPNVFSDIKNLGTLTGELLLLNGGAAPGAFSCNIFDRLSLNTDLSSPFITSFSPRTYCIYALASGNSGHFAKITNSSFTIPANSNVWFTLDQIPAYSLEDVSVNDGGTLLNTRFVHSESSTIPEVLGLYNVRENFGRFPLNLTSGLQFTDQSVLVYDGLTNNGLPSVGKTCMFSASQPLYPPAANWNAKVEKYPKSASSFEGWVNIAGTWKTYGTISA